MKKIITKDMQYFIEVEKPCIAKNKEDAIMPGEFCLVKVYDSNRKWIGNYNYHFVDRMEIAALNLDNEAEDNFLKGIAELRVEVDLKEGVATGNKVANKIIQINGDLREYKQTLIEELRHKNCG